MKRLMRGAGIYVVLAIIAVLVLTTLFRGDSPRKQLSLSEFEGHVAAKQVRSAEVNDGSRKVQGVLANGQKFQVRFPAEYADELTEKLLAAKVPTEAKETKSNAFLNFLIGMLPFVLIIGAFIWILNSMQG